MSLAQEFKTFAMKGNVIDLAVGVVIGGVGGMGGVGGGTKCAGIDGKYPLSPLIWWPRGTSK